MKKAQVEFIAIIAIIAVVVVVVFFAFQMTTIDSDAGLSQTQKTVKHSIQGYIQEAVYSVMRNQSKYGGYLNNYDFNYFEEYLGDYVPYWYYQGQVNHPDVEQIFTDGVNDYISDNIENLRQSFTGLNVTFGSPITSTQIFDNKVIVSLTMSVTVNGQSVPQPIRVEVPTRFGEVIDFSERFVDFVHSQRPFETFTIKSMLDSPYEGNYPSIPVAVLLLHCGDYIYKDWWDIKPNAETAIKKMLSHTYMPGKVPNVETDSFNPLPALGGNEFGDLSIRFQIPDEFELSQNTLRFTPNPIQGQTEFSMMGCLPKLIYVKYSMLYPIIVTVKDPITDNLFRFAIHVYIKDTRKGDWSDMADYDYGDMYEVCNDLSCTADITVVDSSSMPVPGAHVSFMGCGLGTTDVNGELKQSVPCGAGSVEARKSGYATTTVMKSTSDVSGQNQLDGLTITMEKTPSVTFHLYEVKVENNSDQSQYAIKSGQDIIDLVEDRYVYLSFALQGTTEPINIYTENAVVLENKLSPGWHRVYAELYDENFNILGEFVSNFYLEEEDDGKDFYVYLPSLLNYEIPSSEEDIDQRIDDATKMGNLMIQCLDGPFRETPVPDDRDACFKGYDEL